jgi:hypothetical protein
MATGLSADDGPGQIALQIREDGPRQVTGSIRLGPRRDVCEVEAAVEQANALARVEQLQQSSGVDYTVANASRQYIVACCRHG